MSIFTGTTELANVYVGTTEITDIYVGTTNVWTTGGETSTGNLYSITAGRVLSIWDSDNNFDAISSTTLTLPNGATSIISMAINNDKLYVNTDMSHICEVDLSDYSVSYKFSISSTITNANIAFDTDGSLWAGYNKQVAQFDMSDGSVLTAKTTITSALFFKGFTIINGRCFGVPNGTSNKFEEYDLDTLTRINVSSTFQAVRYPKGMGGTDTRLFCHSENTNLNLTEVDPDTLVLIESLNVAIGTSANRGLDFLGY
jgi:hypothetical protein